MGQVARVLLGLLVGVAIATPLSGVASEPMPDNVYIAVYAGGNAAADSR